MIPVVFINCRLFPFLVWIMSGRKLYESRTRNTLRALVGQRVYLAETGRGAPVVRASAIIAEVVPVYSRSVWRQLRSAHRVPAGSAYDWQPGARVKYLYRMAAVAPVPPFTPPEGVRHGRVWMEYNPDPLRVSEPEKGGIIHE